MFPWIQVLDILCKLYCYYSTESVKIISINSKDFISAFFDKYVMRLTLFTLQASISYLLPDYAAMTPAKQALEMLSLLLAKTA